MTEDNNLTGLEIAVIGMAGRFPGANNIIEFWENLKNGVETITFFSPGEVQAGANPENLNQSNYVKAKATLQRIEYFDADFFGYSPKEAEIMDPQMRVFYECVWHALEDAGYDPGTYKKLIGLYAGARSSFYWEANTLVSGRNRDYGDFAASILNDKDYLSARISYRLNLRGPCYTIQTACSTSLAAIHLACQGLLGAECDMALAGGISLALSQKYGYRYREGMIFSADGHCRTFDAGASGTVFGDGVGIAVLKRYEDALKDGDHIYALIKGSACNNDGIDRIGFTAPGIEGQTAVIRSALAMAEVNPETIGYIEAHGTGTSLGDPIEIEALTRAFHTEKKNYCGIGSVKTNVGHLSTAAGVTGFIKTVLALKYKLIPPSLHFTRANPKIDFDNSPFYVSTRLKEWKSNGCPLRAGVSSFGIGGTNAHVVLEECLDKEITGDQEGTGGLAPLLFLLSAKTQTALDKMTANLAAYLGNNPDIDPADVAYTLQVGRKAFNHRRMLVCSSIEEAGKILSESTPGKIKTFFTSEEKKNAIFMFPGQGSQYVNMGKGLYQTESVFRQEIDRCFEILKPLMGYDPKEILYPGDSVSKESSSVPSVSSVAKKIDQTEIAQPLLFAFEYALAKLLMQWGLEPHAMTGHSIGEYTAACLAGVISLPDALMLVALRGQLMQKMPVGAMLSVPISEEKLKPLLEANANEDISLAAVNASDNCVVSGTGQAISEFEEQLKKQRYECRHLHTSHAYHSKMMEPILTAFEKQFQRIRTKLNAPKIPYISNLTGDWISHKETGDPGYWAKHLRQPVRFSDGLSQLFTVDDALFIEVGPGSSLSAFAKKGSATPTYSRSAGCRSFEGVISKVCRKNNVEVVHLIRHPKEKVGDVPFLLNKIGQCWLYGKDIDWTGFYPGKNRRRLPLPGYPFGGQRFWIEGNSRDLFKAGREIPAESQLDRMSDPADWFYIPQWNRSGLLTGPVLSPGQQTLAAAPCTWLVFMDDCGLGTRLLKALSKEQQEVVPVKMGTGFAALEGQKSGYRIHPRRSDDYHALIETLQKRDKLPQRILHLWGITGQKKNETKYGPEMIERDLNTGFYSLLYLVQAIGSRGITHNIRLEAVTDHMQGVTGEEFLCPGKAALASMIKCIPVEYPNMDCRSIDVVWPWPGKVEKEKFIRRLLAELGIDSPDREVALRGAHRWVRSFTPVPLPEVPETPSLIQERGIYLITGGLGGMGLTLSQYLVKTVKARLILTGRSPFPPRNQWREWLETHGNEDQTSLKIKKLQEMEKLGGEILVFSCDVTDKEKVQEIVDLAVKQWGKINGVIHAAGVPDGSIIQRKKPGDIEPVLAPKIKGTLVLDAVFQDMDSPLDFIIYCSSLHSFLGKMGQVAYAAANEFLDAYAYYKNLNCPDQTYIVSINWDAWQEVGMAADTVSNKQGIFPTEGLEIFKRILGSKNKFFQVAVSVSDLNRLIRGVQSSKKLIGGKTAEKSIIPGERYSRPELSTGYAAPRNKLEEEIVGIWQEYFGIREIGIHDNFFELGGDSLKGMKFVSSYNQLLGEIVYINAVFEAPTPAELSAYLQEHYPEAVKKVLGAGLERDNRTRRREIDREMIEKISRLLPSSLPPKEKTGKKIVKNPPAVFILSPPRSGSTLLRVMLAGHPRLFAPPELGLLFFNTLDEVDFTKQSLIRAIMQIKNGRVEEAKGIIDRYRQQQLTTKQFYRWLQEEIGERILVDKTPNYALNPAVLEKTEQEFEGPFYIHLLRHPYGMIRSYEEAKLDLIRGERILEKLSLTRREYAELTWLINHQNIIEFLKNIPDRRQYKLIFEDLVTRPREIITGICGFLGLDMHPDMLRPYKDKKQRMTDGIYSEGIMVGDVKFHRHKKIDPKVAYTWKQHFHEDFLGQPTWEIAESFGYSRINKENKESVETYIPLESIEKKEYYPLSPAQMRLYILERLGSGIGYNISRVLALEGQLEIKELQKIFEQIIKRHESFRTSFDLVRGEPVQRIHREVDFEIEYYDIITDLENYKLQNTNYKQNTKYKLQITNKEKPFGRIINAFGGDLATEDTENTEGTRRLSALISSFIRDFDLSEAPLLRIGLIKIAQNKYLLVKDMHHIISDGGSMGILIRDFAALCENKELPLLRIRYRDYAQWQNRGQGQDAIKKQEQYWTGLFAGDIPVLNIPTDFPRPPRQDFEGATNNFRIDKQEFTLLKNMAVQEGVSFFMVILSLFNILLGKLSGQEDIILGIDMEGRGHEHLRDIIGMFANTLALRNFPAPGKTFKEFLQQVKHQTLNAFENREYPFEELVEKVSIERDVSRNPVFDVLFSFLDLKSGQANQEIQWSRSQLKMKPFNYQNNTAKFDLTLIAREREEDVTFSIEYCTKLFRKETIRRYGQYFKKIVSAVIADRNQKISQIRIITDEEKKQVLFEFNHTKTPLVRDKNYSQLFEEQVSKHPNRIAALHNDNTVTYHELNKEADRIAGALVEYGVIPGTNTALYLKRSIAMLAGIIGIFKAGGAYVPLEVDYPPARVRYILENSEARVVITENEYQEILQKIQESSSSSTVKKLSIINKSFCRGSRGAVFSKRAPLAAGGKRSPDDLAYIIYTSGTTGEPKGVMIHQLGMINHLYAKIDDLGINRADIIAQTASACFDISVWQFLAGLLTGGCTCIIDKETVLESRKLLRLLQQRRVTILETVPSLMKAFLETAANETDNALDRLRWMVPTGEPLTVPLVKAWFRGYPHIKLVNAYGPTEASDDVTHYQIDKMPPETETSIPIGKPLQNLHIYILDKNLSLCPIGVRGEIYVAGVGVGKGYLNNPELTEERFKRAVISHSSLVIRNLKRAVNSHLSLVIGSSKSFPNDQCPMTNDRSYKLYKTGDLGYFKLDGNIECLGRMDYQVKIRGNRVELGEIESRLLAHSRIKEAVVVDRVKPGGDLYLCAYIVSKQPEALAGQPRHTDINGPMPSDSTLREYLAQSLPAYMIPSYFVPMEKLPLTPNQKIDREALPEPGIPGSNRQYIPPGDEIQEKVVHMCAQVLALEKENISITDDFFRMGGNSLEAVKFVALAKKELNVEIPIAALFERPVIKDISMFIKAAKYEEKPAVLLNPGIPAQKNLFCFPPGGAYGLVYREFAAVIKNISVYTCHFIEEEDRLEQYVNIVTDIQPRGPYVVLGYSAAGKLVFQVTRALENQGREVSDIILVDSVFRKDIDEQKIIDKYTAFINAILERMDDLGIGFLKERIKDKMQKYLKYNLGVTNLEKVHANVQFIVGEETARGKTENLHCWDDLTTKKVVLHKGFGDHISMFQPGVLEKNTALIQGILDNT